MANDMQEVVMPTSVVLNELDEFSKQWEALRQKEVGWKCRRAKTRRQFRTACEIWFFENGGKTVRRMPARTRNLSERGIGLMTKSVILQGAPIEIRIQPPERPPLHLGGVVIFCHYTRRSFHEVGVALKTCQAEPIFSDDPIKAIKSVPWLQRALRDLLLSPTLAKAQTAANRG